MASPRGLAEAAAAALSDGLSVDWDSIDQRLLGAPDQKVAQGLRVVERLTSVHASEKSPDAAGRSRLRPAARLLRTVAAIHIVTGLAAFAVGPSDTSPVPAYWPLAALVALSGVGALLAWRGADRRVQYLGLFFMLVATSFSQRFIDLSRDRAAVLAIVSCLHLEVFFPVVLWLFARDFPRTVILSRPDALCNAGIRVSALVGCVLFVVNLNPTPEGAAWFLSRNASGYTYWLLLSGMTVLALIVVVAKRRWAPVRESRRVTLFMATLVVALGPMLLEILAEILFPAVDAFMSEPAARRAGAWVVFPPLLSIPFITAYAMTAPRVLPVDHVVRRAFGYALARATLLAATLIPLLLLAVSMVRNGDQTVVEALSTLRVRGLAILTVLSLLLLCVREPLLVRMKRLFGRGQVDLHAALASVAERVHRVGGALELATRLADDLRTLLGVERAAILIRQDGLGRYDAVLGDHPPLGARWAIVELLTVSDEPLNVDPDDDRSVFRWLPSVERNWVAQSGCSLVVALREPSGVLIGCLAVGAKRSDTPLDRDEKLLLRGVSTPVAMALLRWGDGTNQGPRTKGVIASQCRSCRRVQEPAVSSCSACGGLLEDAALPKFLFDRFSVDRLLGRGGMGLVYECTDLGLGRRVAIKTLPHLGTDAALRLRREARAMAWLSHPHIATVHGLETWEGRPLLIVEYLAGGTLADRLRQGPLTVAEVLRLGDALGDALEALHAAGVVHGDVKPSNVGYTLLSIAKLLDFGLVRGTPEPLRPVAVASVTKGPPQPMDSTHVRFGTPLYLPPEALMGKRAVHAERDLWALALTLYEALAGKHPFEGARSIDELNAALQKGVPDIGSLRADVPAVLADWLAGALCVDEKERPASASQMRSAMARLSKSTTS